MIYIFSFLLIGIAFLGIAIKILFLKNGTFNAKCFRNYPLNKDKTCNTCGKIFDDYTDNNCKK